jgi:Cu+-exporting ATPase
MSDQKITLPVSGMTCTNCAMNIERGVKKLNGVKEANVNFAAEQANIAFDPKLLGLGEVLKKIEDTGFKVATVKVELPVTGMTCNNCAINIERALNRKVPGVVNASANFATERASIEYIPSMATLADILQTIQDAGYGAVLPDETIDEQDAEQAARDAEIKDQTQAERPGGDVAPAIFELDPQGMHALLL